MFRFFPWISWPRLKNPLLSWAELHFSLSRHHVSFAKHLCLSWTNLRMFDYFKLSIIFLQGFRTQNKVKIINRVNVLHKNCCGSTNRKIILLFHEILLRQLKLAKKGLTHGRKICSINGCIFKGKGFCFTAKISQRGSEPYSHFRHFFCFVHGICFFCLF